MLQILCNQGYRFAFPGFGLRFLYHDLRAGYPIRSDFVLPGKAAVFLASLSGCLVLLAVGFNVSLPFVFLTSLVLALITTLVEAVSFHSLDNLTIQIATSGASGLIFGMWGG